MSMTNKQYAKALVDYRGSKRLVLKALTADVSDAMTLAMEAMREEIIDFIGNQNVEGTEYLIEHIAVMPLPKLPDYDLHV